MTLLKKTTFIFILLLMPFFIEAVDNLKTDIDKTEFHILDIIQKKRDNKELSKNEINYFVQEYTNGNIPNYQASAFLMAIFINDMSAEETAFLTDAMIRSGTIINFDELKEPIVDKHSTGGVGDKTSLIIAPICASLGLRVPMISGRGLGHTGGTLDKLESIPGFSVDQDNESYKRLVKDVGVCIIGQTIDIAPADKKIYALRDVSGSVESLPLIASSIMSKKMAEGLDVLIMDVKTGSGALMKKYEDSCKLAQTMIDIGKNLNTKVVAIVSDMNQPLGMCIGNSLEIMEVIGILKGTSLKDQKDLIDLSFKLASLMLIKTNCAEDAKDAYAQIQKVIDNGSALEKFKEMITAQGGNPDVIYDQNLFEQSDFRYCLKASRSGYIHTLDALKIAKGCTLLGAGRQTIDSQIDFSVGAILHKKIGSFVNQEDTIIEIHYNSEEKLKAALSLFEDAIIIDKDIPSKPVLIKKIFN